MAGRGINKGLVNGGDSIKFFDDGLEIFTPPYLHWLHRLVGLYSSVFKYKNMPKTVDIVEAEKWLVDYGMICLYELPEIGLVCLPAQNGGVKNAYGHPVKINVISLNGFTETVDIENSCICYDNINHDVPRYDLGYYSKRLANMDITIDVNTDNQRTPYVWEATKEQELSIKNINNQIQRGNRAIFLNKKTSEEMGAGIIQTPAPYVADKIQIQKDALLTEVANFMGVFAGTSLKAERVSSGENAGQVGFIRAARNSRYFQRLKFVEAINEKFPQYLEAPVEVEYSEETIESIAAGLLQVGVNKERGAENGELYD